MKDLTAILMFVGILLVTYFAINAMTTTNPSRRKRDIRDIRIIGTALNILG